MSINMSGLMFWGSWFGGASLVVLLTYGVWLRFGARIHSRERAYWIDRPFPLTGRLDLVMQDWGGRLVVHDLKTRQVDKVFESDKLQLALYAFLLSRATGRNVATHAVVRIQTGNGSIKLRSVQLEIDPAHLHGLADAFLASAAQPTSARLTAVPALCRRCGFNGRGCSGKAAPNRR